MSLWNNFPYSNTHELNLDWIIKVVKEWGATVEEYVIKFNDLNEAFISLKNFVDTYFENLDVQEEVNNKLNEMAENGELIELIAPYLPFVTPEMYGAQKDGVTDDLLAFNQALSSGRPVMLTSGTYYLSDTIVMPNNTSLSGEDRNRSIIKFADNKTGVQINHSIKLSDLTIDFSGEGVGVYMYTPDNYSYDLSSIVENVRIRHYDNTVLGTAILLEAEHIENKPQGAYNLVFRDIDIRNNVQYGIHLHNKAKQADYNECWLTDMNFEDIFISSAMYAITSDWTDVSGTSAVPTTGAAPRNGNINFVRVSAQYVDGVSNYFLKIFNAINVTLDRCMSFDYWHLRYDHSLRQIHLNALRAMCRVDLGLFPELAEPLNLYIDYINSSGTFNTDFFSTVIQLKLTADKNEVYNNIVRQLRYEATPTPSEQVANVNTTVQKIGNIAMLFFYGRVTVETAYSPVDICTLPEGYRISRSISKTITPAYDNVRAILDIKESGAVQLTFTTAGTYTVSINETYLTK